MTHDEGDDVDGDTDGENVSERDEDALWRSIVENYGDRVILDPAADPATDPATDKTADPAPGAPARPEPEPPDDRIRDDAGEPDLLDAWDDPDDHFVPPVPPPLPSMDPPRLLAWVGVLGVPILVIVVAALGISVPSFASLLGLAWFMGGFGYLVATMRRDDSDEGGDDGAVL